MGIVKLLVFSKKFRGRYDLILMAGLLYSNKINSKNIRMIARGNRLYQLKVFSCRPKRKRVTKTEFKDSFNLIPVKLESFPKTFGLKDVDGGPLEEKGIFPYYFNDPANYDRVMDHLPSIFHFDLNLPSDKFVSFCKWFEEKFHHLDYALPRILDEYCSQDVRILAYGLFEYRKIVKQITNIDPLL